MKKYLLALLFVIVTVPAWAQCEPTAATPGMIGCWPRVTTMAGTDSIDIWQPGAFPASANRIHLTDFLNNSGVLQTANNLSEIAANGSGAQATARGNLGISGAAGPYLPLAGGTVSGAVVFNGALSGSGVTGLFASPLAIGNVVPNTGVFTTLSATSAISGAGFTAFMASPPSIGSSAPNTGAFTTLSATGAINTTSALGYQINGATVINATSGGIPTVSSLLIGTGTLTGLPYQFQNALNIDPSTQLSLNRQTMFQETLTYNNGIPTANTWEGLTAFTYVNGPGQANGEINGIHDYFQYNCSVTGTNVCTTGARVQAVENFEASMENFATITGTHVGYLSTLDNRSTGTANTIFGAKFGLDNENVASGAITVYGAYDMEPLQGGGSVPTNYYYLRGAEPLAGSALSGNLTVGGLDIAGAGAAGNILHVEADANTGHFPFSVSTAALGNLFMVGGDGQVYLGAAKFDINGNLHAAVITGSGNFFLTAIPGSAGSGGLYVCVDSTGEFYKKSSCP